MNRIFSFICLKIHLKMEPVGWHLAANRSDKAQIGQRFFRPTNVKMGKGFCVLTGPLECPEAAYLSVTCPLPERLTFDVRAINWLIRDFHLLASGDEFESWKTTATDFVLGMPQERTGPCTKHVTRPTPAKWWRSRKFACRWPRTASPCPPYAKFPCSSKWRSTNIPTSSGKRPFDFSNFLWGGTVAPLAAIGAPPSGQEVTPTFCVVRCLHFSWFASEANSSQWSALGGRRSWVRGSLFRAIFFVWIFSFLLNFGAAERVLRLPAVGFVCSCASIKALDFWVCHSSRSARPCRCRWTVAPFWADIPWTDPAIPLNENCFKSKVWSHHI